MYAAGGMREQDVPVEANAELRYTSPNGARPGVPNRFYMRPRRPLADAVLRAVQGGKVLREQRLPAARPAEMLSMEITPDDESVGKIVFELEGTAI